MGRAPQLWREPPSPASAPRSAIAAAKTRYQSTPGLLALRCSIWGAQRPTGPSSQPCDCQLLPQTVAIPLAVSPWLEPRAQVPSALAGERGCSLAEGRGLLYTSKACLRSVTPLLPPSRGY